MSIWSPNTLQQRFRKKAVPEGSNDFQKVLDDILCSDDNDYQRDFEQFTEIKISHQGHYRNDGNHQQIDKTKETFPSSDKLKLLDSIRDNNNNHNNDTFSSHKCAIDICQQQCRALTSETADKSCVSITNTDCVDKICNNEGLENNINELTFSICETGNYIVKMGASCSSNFYDHREWHNVKGDINIESVKPKKRGRLRKKRVSSEQTSETRSERASPYSQGDKVDPEKFISARYICQQEDSNIQILEQPARPRDFQANSLNIISEKRTSPMLSPDNGPENSCTKLTCNRLSPNVDSSGHVRISRVVGSGRARATAELDVSPHRLLTRRNNLQIGQFTGIITKSIVNSSDDRPRSHSWSNGKNGTKANFKTSSLTIRQTLSSTVKSLTNSSQILLEKSLRNSQNSITVAIKLPVNGEVHDRDCLQRIKIEGVPKISILKAQFKINDEFDSDLSPIARRRAASESQTMRPRRLLPRAPDSSDQIQEHMHVRWADEEKGSSLSTSVFLSNIRPRSRSYGAVDSIPHRPILKKVAGF